MRQYASELGYRLNEHGIYHKSNLKKVEQVFNTEKDIFTFLNLQYKDPQDRLGKESLILKDKSKSK